jgi:hypothetical protein
VRAQGCTESVLDVLAQICCGATKKFVRYGVGTIDVGWGIRIIRFFLGIRHGCDAASGIAAQRKEMTRLFRKPELGSSLICAAACYCEGLSFWRVGFGSGGLLTVSGACKVKFNRVSEGSLIC